MLLHSTRNAFAYAIFMLAIAGPVESSSVTSRPSR